MNLSGKLTLGYEKLEEKKKNTQKKEWKKNMGGNLQWASFIQNKMWQNNPPPQPYFFL